MFGVSQVSVQQAGLRPRLFKDKCEGASSERLPEGNFLLQASVQAGAVA